MGEYANDEIMREMRAMGIDPGKDFDYQEGVRTYNARGTSQKQRTHCPHCKKQVSVVGLPDHIKAKHCEATGEQA